MDLTQISLRTSRDQVERIKTYAKASNLSVNAFLVNLIENSLNNIANDGTQSELTRLVAEPVKTLSRLHHKICDPWNTNEPADLTPAEIAFLTDAAGSNWIANIWLALITLQYVTASIIP